MKSLTLSIAEPCHENWDKMNPTEKGRFCLSCQKQVIDFTMMTDREVYDYFTVEKTGNVCGRLMPDQMNTPIAKPASIKKKKLWYVQYLTGLFLLLGKQESKAQSAPAVELRPHSIPPTIKGEISMAVPAEMKKVFSGKVIDAAGLPVPFASIRIKGTKTGMSADVNGVFSVSVHPGDRFEVMAAGYISKEVSQESTVITLDKDPGYLVKEIVAIAGGLSYHFDTDNPAPDQPRYITKLLVKNKATAAVIPNASISIVKNQKKLSRKPKTDYAGVFELHNIKAEDEYTLTISAKGYKEQVIKIEGSQFTKKRSKQEVLLETEEMKTMPEVVVLSRYTLNNADTGKNTTVMTLHGRVGCPILLPEIKQLPPAPYRANGTFGNSVKMGGVTAGIPIHKKESVPLFKKIINAVSLKTKAVATLPVFNIYPNPVTTNAVVNIEMKQLVPGNYQLQLISLSGEMIQQDKITVPVKDFTFQWLIGAKVTAGEYILQLSGNGKAVGNRKIIIL
jgi:hypothetical protein